MNAPFPPRSFGGLGDNAIEEVGAFHPLPAGTIVPDAPEVDDSTDHEH